jgi:hypothetical protein
MGGSPSTGDHIVLKKGSLAFIVALLRSKELVVWKMGSRGRRLVRFLVVLGKRASYVATDDVEGREYAVYSELLWWMLSESEREKIIRENRARFNAYAERIKAIDLDKAFIFGNGPSLEKAIEFDFSDGLRIMCNSIVSNHRLLNHVRPHFLVAGDPLSHFGVSTYADKYRQDLFEALSKFDIGLVIPEFQGFILVANYPEYADRIFLVPLKAKVPNYDMVVNYRLPLFWSVLNAAMLPLAATFVDDVYLLGCDGKSTKTSNEDFWAHARGVQYDDLVAMGHACHPTFDIHRRSHPEYVRVQLDLAHTIIMGEQLHFKKYKVLSPSNMVPLDSRMVEQNILESHRVAVKRQIR